MTVASKSPNNVTNTFFSTAKFLSKYLRFKHEGVKLVSCLLHNYKFFPRSVKQSSTSKGLSKHMRAFLRAKHNWLHHYLHGVSRNRIGKK